MLQAVPQLIDVNRFRGRGERRRMMRHFTAEVGQLRRDGQCLRVVEPRVDTQRQLLTANLFGQLPVLAHVLRVRRDVEIVKRVRQRHIPRLLLVLFRSHAAVDQELAVIEVLQAGDAKPLQLGRIDFFSQVTTESRQAMPAETTGQPPDRSGRSAVVVDVQSVRARGHALSQTALQILPIERTVRAPPPGRLSLVLVVPQPRHNERLAGEISGGGIQVVLAEINRALEFREESHADRKEPHPLLMSFRNVIPIGRTRPPHDGTAVGFIHLRIVVHEYDVGVAYARTIGCAGRTLSLSHARTAHPQGAQDQTHASDEH